jgi:hypothetical protein
MKKIIFVALTCLYSFGAHSQVRTFDIKMTPCLIGSDCNKCAEVIAVKYDVDSQNKAVKISGTSIQGEEISEVLKSCDVQDISNWSCRHAAISVSVKNNIVSIETNKNSSMYSSGKQICLIK